MAAPQPPILESRDHRVDQSEALLSASLKDAERLVEKVQLGKSQLDPGGIGGIDAAWRSRLRLLVAGTVCAAVTASAAATVPGVFEGAAPPTRGILVGVLSVLAGVLTAVAVWLFDMRFRRGRASVSNPS